MKLTKTLLATAASAALLLGPAAGLAADPQPGAKTKPKPYPLKTCLVTDEKLGEMGKPYTFVHEGQEIQLCCKSCLKGFNKNPKKYLAKLKNDGKEKK